LDRFALPPKRIIHQIATDRLFILFSFPLPNSTSSTTQIWLLPRRSGAAGDLQLQVQLAARKDDVEPLPRLIGGALAGRARIEALPLNGTCRQVEP
jgi:hypothetical protein